MKKSRESSNLEPFALKIYNLKHLFQVCIFFAGSLDKVKLPRMPSMNSCSSGNYANRRWHIGISVCNEFFYFDKSFYMSEHVSTSRGLIRV